MKRILLLCVAAFPFFLKAQSPVREIVLLDKNWSFIQKDVPHGESPQIKDGDWTKVSVPHDWAITGNFDMNIDKQTVQVVEDGEKVARLRTGRTGALPCFGIGWYRKVLPVTANDQGKRIFIEFDGAMSRAKVFINGEFVGERPYGYSSFSFEISKYLKFGQDNILAVRIENPEESSRWYPGAGIYRNVRLVKTSDLRIAQWGTFVTTPVVNAKSSDVNIKTEIDGSAGAPQSVKLVTDIYNTAGVKVASVTSAKKSNEKLLFDQTLKVKAPQLWSI